MTTAIQKQCLIHVWLEIQDLFPDELSLNLSIK